MMSKDNYVKIRTLGRGAFGDVGLVEDRTNGKRYALKIIEKKLLTRVYNLCRNLSNIKLI